MENSISLVRWLTLFGIFFLMLSKNLMNISLMGAVFLSLFVGHWRDRLKLIFKNPVTNWAMMLLLIFIIGSFYSQGSESHIYQTVDKYAKIIYLLLLIPFFVDQKWRQKASIALVIGVSISLLLSYLHYFEWDNFDVPAVKHSLFVQDIDASFIIAFTCFILVSHLLDGKRLKRSCFLLLLFFIYDLLFINRQRTGYAVFLGLSGLMLWQRLGWRGILSAVLIVPLLMMTLYFTSNTFHQRINLIAHDVSHYIEGHEMTSIGLRLSFAKYSFQVIKSSPIWGVGTGSFEDVYPKTGGPTLEDNTWPAHPHNEYILILFQTGIVGLCVFLVWLVMQMKETFYLPLKEQRLAQGLIIAFMILSCCNASLYLNPAGNFYILLLTVFFAAKYKQPEVYPLPSKAVLTCE